MDVRQALADDLEAARARSLGLLDPLPEPLQQRQHSTLMSPVVWDLAHVGNYEEIWLLGRLGFDRVNASLDGVYDAFLTPRAQRKKLPMLGPGEARAYVGEVRGRVLDTLERIDLDAPDPHVRDGYLYRMVVQHEHMHDETILAALQLLEEGYARWNPALTFADGARALIPLGEVFVEGGPFQMGSDTEPWAFDNERPAHTVDLPPYHIDAAPVTNEQYVAFIDAGGYDDPRHWTEDGWAWRTKADLAHPQFWRRDGARSWSVERFGHLIPLAPAEPVQHVCWYEADAYARWAGKRLPTEAEWEKAASWDPATSTKRRYPWGSDGSSFEQANVSQHLFGPAPVGSFPHGASAYGAHQMLGDVWEWTASDFMPYPDFGAFPYKEYSEVFFGAKFKVLRGGAWATHQSVARTTFRNWDYPIRRQIFCGFRCARDA
jgi:iron(II)-dependent oxidoreductase